MRQRLGKFLSIVLVAMAVQILAPIAASWAAFSAASDPLQSVEICHGSDQSDQGGSHSAHDGTCLICCAMQAGGAVDTPPQTGLLLPYRQTTRVVWHLSAADVSPTRARSNTQARAPPLPI
jgi:hypothetical protein